jgi:hypothetical protein
MKGLTCQSLGRESLRSKILVMQLVSYFDLLITLPFCRRSTMEGIYNLKCF